MPELRSACFLISVFYSVAFVLFFCQEHTFKRLVKTVHTDKVWSFVSPQIKAERLPLASPGRVLIKVNQTMSPHITACWEEKRNGVLTHTKRIWCPPPSQRLQLSGCRTLSPAQTPQKRAWWPTSKGKTQLIARYRPSTAMYLYSFTVSFDFLSRMDTKQFPSCLQLLQEFSRFGLPEPENSVGLECSFVSAYCEFWNEINLTSLNLCVYQLQSITQVIKLTKNKLMQTGRIPLSLMRPDFKGTLQWIFSNLLV